MKGRSSFFWYFIAEITYIMSGIAKVVISNFTTFFTLIFIEFFFADMARFLFFELIFLFLCQ